MFPALGKGRKTLLPQPIMRGQGLTLLREAYTRGGCSREKAMKMTLPSLSHGAPPVVYATPGDRGTTSLVMSSPSLSLIRDDV